MFGNMKMDMKVMCAMILMTVIILIVGWVGIFGMNQINKSQDEIAKVMLPGIVAPGIINEAQMAIQGAERTFKIFKWLLIVTIVLSILLAVTIVIRIKRDLNNICAGLKDLSAISLNNAVANLNDLRNEMLRLTKALQEGTLSERGRTEQFQGAYAEIVQGVNRMLNAILLPIGAGNRILGLIRRGNLQKKVEIDCNGDHEQMKDAVNGLHAWLSELAAYVKKLANGDLTAEISEASEEDQIHGWLVLIKNNIQALVADTSMLAKAAVDGNFALRADAVKYRGDFRKIVSSINEIFDTVIEPVKLASEYKERIANFEISPKISDSDRVDAKDVFFEMIAKNKPYI